MSARSTSIALTTYNGVSYLVEQFNSVSSQTIKPNQIIISDDASTDNSVNLIENLARQASCLVKIIRNQTNLGYTRNFSNALQECSGDIVFLCDQDDVWSPNKIEAVLEVFEANPRALLVIHDLEFCDANLQSLGQTKIQRFRWNSSSLDQYVTGMATAIRGDFLKLCLPVPAKNFTHDLWLHTCAQILRGRIVMPRVLAKYRRHASNAASNFPINHARKTTFLILFIRKLSSSLKIGGVALYKQELDKKRILKDWLAAKKNELISNSFCSEANFSRAFTILQTNIQILERRLAILKMRRAHRLGPAIQLHFKNGISLRTVGRIIKDIMVK